MKYDHLTGLEFKHGSRDCYELLRDFYRDNHEIELRNYARPDNWWDKGLDLYFDHFRDEGFEAVDVKPRDVRISDVFLMAVYQDSVRKTAIENHTRVANHCGIYLGNGKMLHHFFGRRSEVIQYASLWRNTTVAIIRHKDVPLVKPAMKTVDYMELLPPYLRMKFERAAQLQHGNEGESGLHPAGG